MNYLKLNEVMMGLEVVENKKKSKINITTKS